jgi:hypothetical protein
MVAKSIFSGLGSGFSFNVSTPDIGAQLDQAGQQITSQINQDVNQVASQLPVSIHIGTPAAPAYDWRTDPVKLAMIEAARASASQSASAGGAATAAAQAAAAAAARQAQIYAANSVYTGGQIGPSSPSSYLYSAPGKSTWLWLGAGVAALGAAFFWWRNK